MTLDEAIERYTSNAEYERTYGNLQGCLEFILLAEWLKELKWLREQTRWIPVSERLPKKNVWVLVTVVQGSGLYVEIMRIDKYKGMFTDNIGYYGSVIAWMPLPQPYELQESEVSDADSD